LHNVPNASNIPQSPVYNVNPTPQSGSGLWGSNPGPIGIPNPQADLGAVYPNLSGTNALTSADLLSQLNGSLSKDTLSQLQDTAAQYGVSSGEGPGSGQEQNLYLSEVARASNAETQGGIGAYGSVIPTASKTQTVAPNWETQIAEANAISSAQANPFLAGLGSTLASLGGLGATLAIGSGSTSIGGGPQGGDWNNPNAATSDYGSQDAALTSQLGYGDSLATYDD